MQAMKQVAQSLTEIMVPKDFAFRQRLEAWVLAVTRDVRFRHVKPPKRKN